MNEKKKIVGLITVFAVVSILVFTTAIVLKQRGNTAVGNAAFGSGSMVQNSILEDLFITSTPSNTPSSSMTPSHYPSETPTMSSAHPSTIPSMYPSTLPSSYPSTTPSTKPTLSSSTPTTSPSLTSSTKPSSIPTYNPTLSQTPTYTRIPSETPSMSVNPTLLPTTTPTISITPSENPSSFPSISLSPSSIPSKSVEPTTHPSGLPSLSPTLSQKPTSSPTLSHIPTTTSMPSQTPTVEMYIPGKMWKDKVNDIFLSNGLRARLIAKGGDPVPLHNGKFSKKSFHKYPDGAAIFEDTKKGDGSYVYVSNSEVKSTGEGGVGAIRFDKHGNVLDYYMVLEDTEKNCSGGKTPWNTWVSCEEASGGLIWEVDPFGDHKANLTVMGGEKGGRFESVAVDNRNPEKPIFYVSHDAKQGEIRRFTPNVTLSEKDDEDDDSFVKYHEVLTTPGQIDYVVLHPETMTFRWTDDLEEGKQSAENYFQFCEGIDFRDGILYYVSKEQDELFILDVDKMTYKKESTINGYFDGSPDQLVRLQNSPESSLIYFTEENGKYAGIHARDGTDGSYYTILEADKSETSGLAFSPDNKRMYFAFYKNWKIFEVTRVDGKPFGGGFTTLRHHRNMR